MLCSSLAPKNLVELIKLALREANLAIAEDETLVERLVEPGLVIQCCPRPPRRPAFVQPSSDLRLALEAHRWRLAVVLGPAVAPDDRRGANDALLQVLREVAPHLVEWMRLTPTRRDYDVNAQPLTQPVLK